MLLYCCCYIVGMCIIYQKTKTKIKKCYIVVVILLCVIYLSKKTKPKIKKWINPFFYIFLYIQKLKYLLKTI